MSKKNSLDTLVGKFNQTHAVINIQGKFWILTERVDPTNGFTLTDFSSVADQKNFHRNRLVSIIDEKGNEKLVNFIDIWLSSENRREYQGRVFIPGETPDGYYNLWEGFAFVPKKGDCSLYLQHIEKNICKGDESHYKWLIDWMADAIQNPMDRPGTAVVLCGRQGTGKSIMMNFFGKLFRELRHFIHISGQHRLTGNFNKHLEKALFVFVDEGFFAGDKREVGLLKSMITEDYITIEAKFHDPYQQRNYMRIGMATNADWAIPAGLEERRFFVLHVGEDCMQNQEYFRAIINQMNAGGYEALMHFLKNRKIKSNLREVPRTDELWAQILETMDSFDRWWFTCLENGKISQTDSHWERVKPCFSVYESYYKQAVIEGERHKVNDASFGKKLHKTHPKIIREKHNFHDGKGRVWSYFFPDLLECQNHFAKLVRYSIDWGDDE